VRQQNRPRTGSERIVAISQYLIGNDADKNDVSFLTGSVLENQIARFMIRHTQCSNSTIIYHVCARSLTFRTLCSHYFVSRGIYRHLILRSKFSTHLCPLCLFSALFFFFPSLVIFRGLLP